MTYELRPYQQKLVDECREKCKISKKILLQLPTGGGKSLVFVELVKKTLEKNNNARVFIVAHRSELIYQAAAHFKRWLDLPVGIIKGDINPHYDRQIQILSIQSINKNVIKKLGNVDLIIVDEAHHVKANQYQQLFDAWPNAYHIGLTATPCRLDGQSLNDCYDNLVSVVSTSELIEMGHLVKCSYYRDENYIKQIENGVTKNQKLIEHQDMQGSITNILQAYQKYMIGKKSIIFVSGVVLSNLVATKLVNMHNVKAVHIDANTPDRVQLLEDFKDGLIDVIVNVGLFDEGVDVPSLEAVLIATPTESLTKYLQMCGRVLRTHRGKTEGIVVDLTDASLNHGFPTDDRDWHELFAYQKPESEPQEQREKGEGINERLEACSFDDLVKHLLPQTTQKQIYIRKDAVTGFEPYDRSTLDKAVLKLSKKGNWHGAMLAMSEISKREHWKKHAIIFKLLELGTPSLNDVFSWCEELSISRSWAETIYHKKKSDSCDLNHIQS